MSATLEATRPAGHTEKKFGKSTRQVPHHTQKAKKWYPAEDEVQQKKVRSSPADELENETAGPGVFLDVKSIPMEST